MAVDENGNEIIEPVLQQPSRSEERIKQLSEKVELTSKERDEKSRLLEEAQRERDFYAGYSDILSTNPAAKDHKDEIKEKVLKGYSVEDATFAVLGKAGKLGAAPVQTPQVAGGSAATTVTQTGEKSPAEMTQEERRAALEKELMWQ